MKFKVCKLNRHLTTIFLNANNFLIVFIWVICHRKFHYNVCMELYGCVVKELKFVPNILILKIWLLWSATSIYMQFACVLSCVGMMFT